MGHVVSQRCKDSSDYTVAAGVDIVTDAPFGYPVTAVPGDGKVDAVLCFAHAAGEGVMTAIETARRSGTPLVMATTGLSGEQESSLKAAAQTIPVCWSANMSLGVNLMMDLVRRAASVLGLDYDIEIVERHHNTKVDAPSGTALMLYRAAESVLPYEPEPVYDRQPLRRPRGKHEIGLSAVRGGTIVGQHDVIFAGPDEVIEIRHTAQSRDIYATGALRAVAFVVGQVPGLYTMTDVIDA